MFRNLVLILGLALSLVACSKAPQEMLDTVQTALDEAKAKEAEKYAPESFQLAKDAMDSALAEVDAQNGKFVLFRSFDEANKLLEKAKEASAKASAETETNRAAAKRDAEALIADAQIALDSATSAVSVAPAGKGSRADLAMMKVELESLSHSLVEARKAFTEGDYLAAKAKAESVKSQASEIAADIGHAKTKNRTT